MIVGSKWGYRYTGGWRLDAPQQEVKEHSLAMFTAQLAQSRALLGDRLTLYQVHSLTVDSGLFTDAALLLPVIQGERGGVIAGERVHDVNGPARRSRVGPGVQGVGGMLSLSR